MNMILRPIDGDRLPAWHTEWVNVGFGTRCAVSIFEKGRAVAGHADLFASRVGEAQPAGGARAYSACQTEAAEKAAS